MRYYTSLVLFILSLLLSITFYQPRQVQAQTACPLGTDTKTNVDPITNGCYSNNDPLFNPGFNTQGGARSCGPVLCPGGTQALTRGNTCVVQTNGQCYPGIGPSGFNVPGCTQSSTTSLPRCPAPMNLTIQVNDTTGKPVGNVRLTITYEDAPPSNAVGKTTTSITQANGQAIVQNTLYSGDHFMIVPSSPNWAFSPTKIGSPTNLGNQEMNTTFSCGTALENGQNRPPCAFTATATGVTTTTQPGVFQTDPTVFNAEQSVATSMKAIVVIGGIAFGINSLLSLGKSPKQ